MLSDLQNLVRLQQAENDLRRVESTLADIPHRTAALQQRLDEERGRLDAARAAIDESQRTRRQREGELQSHEAKRSKYKAQLMDVKTNKEYTAMLHEIEGVERDVRACEDQILAEMERAETLSAEVRAEEADFKQADAAFKADAARLAEEATRLEAQAAQLRRERDEILGLLSQASRELFARVARLRGVAVSEARDEMCQVCRLKLRPQMYVELKHNDRIVQCPSCSRILYYEPPPPTILVEP